jgi:hypothetical protein
MNSDLVEHLKGYDMGSLLKKSKYGAEYDGDCIREGELKPHYYNVHNIDFLRDSGLLRGFCLGNAIKYIDRAGKKDGETEEKDLRKAMEYLKIYLGDKR